MPATDTRHITVLKGTQFAERVAEICRDLPEVESLPDLRYRRILFPGMIGGEIQFAQLVFIAHALRMRGAEVTGLMCDSFLPACTLQKVDHHESACVRWCHKNIGPFARAAKLPHRWYSEFVSQAEMAECHELVSRVPAGELGTFHWRGISLGEHVSHSIESYFKVGQFETDNPQMVAKGRELLAAAMCLVLIGERALQQLRIEKVFIEDGKKIDWGVIRAVARHQGIPVDVSLGSLRGGHLMVEHDTDPDKFDPMSMWSAWRETPLTTSQEAELEEYFEHRATKPYEDQLWTSAVPVADDGTVRRRVGLKVEPAGLVVAMFPNLGYDAGTTVRRPTYDNAADWVGETIRFFERWPQHHLIVKVHPAETVQQALDPMMEYISASFDSLPDNVHLIEPATDLTAHDILRVSDLALVYTSTVGVEAAYLGIPVVNVGGGWHAGRGISMDVTTRPKYIELMEGICSGRVRPRTSRTLGRRYAYAAFFRRVLPIRYYSALYPNITELHLQDLEDLSP